MNLSFKLFGFEVAKIELTTPEPVVVAEVERNGRKLLGKAIGRVSTAWVATGMK